MINRILNEKEPKHGLSELRLALKVLDKTIISDEDLKKANHTTDKGRQKWDEEGSEKEIEFSNDQVGLITSLIKNKSDEKKFAIEEGVLVVSLSDKLNIE